MEIPSEMAIECMVILNYFCRFQWSLTVNGGTSVILARKIIKFLLEISNGKMIKLDSHKFYIYAMSKLNVILKGVVMGQQP